MFCSTLRKASIQIDGDSRQASCLTFAKRIASNRTVHSGVVVQQEDNTIYSCHRGTSRTRGCGRSDVRGSLRGGFGLDRGQGTGGCGRHSSRYRISDIFHDIHIDDLDDVVGRGNHSSRQNINACCSHFQNRRLHNAGAVC